MPPLSVAVALEGYGWHPEAWRHTPDRQPHFSGRHWVDLARTAERGRLDFVTFDDGLTPQRRRRPEIEPRWLVGRPDAVLVASHVAPATSHIGLIPVAVITHREPAQLAEAIAALDVVSDGRAGWQPRVSGADLFAEAVDIVDAVRGLWDDACQPPQGQPVVAVLAHARPIYEFASRTADLVFATPADDEQVVAMCREIVDVGGAGLKVYADVFVAASGVVDPRTEAYVFDGTATELVELALRWQALGIDGLRLRPAVNAIDLPFIVDEVMPALRAAAAVRSGYTDGEALRDRLGLPAAENRYAKVVQP